MPSRQNAVLDALQRAQRFLDETSAFLIGVDFTTARKRLDDIVTTLTSHASGQNVGERGAKGQTAMQRQLRLTLCVELMQPIATIAGRKRTRSFDVVCHRLFSTISRERTMDAYIWKGAARAPCLTLNASGDAAPTSPPTKADPSRSLP